MPGDEVAERWAVMSQLVRLSVSLERPLFERLEKLVKRSGYTNRSEFVRDLVRGRLVEQEWDKDEEVLGTITLVYDHHRRMLTKTLTGLQHRHHHAVLASTHVHLSAQLCAEVIIMKARASDVRELTDRLQQQKGVLHARLSMASTGAGLR